ncbi:MAG: hypothetical protein WEA04_01920 [Candidatus Andersenbacteria bacterium]
MPTALPKKYLALGAVLLVAVAGLVIASFMVAQRFNKQALAQEAWLKLTAAPSYHARAELLLNLPVRLQGRERPLNQITLRTEGDVVRDTTGVPEFTGTLFTEARGRGTVLFADGQLRLLAEAVAFRLENLPVLVNPTGSLVEKWTYVDSRLLTTRNGPEIRQVLSDVFSQLAYQGKEQDNGGAIWRYAGSLRAEDEARLIATLQHQVSGNHGYHIIARLLQAYDVQSLVVDVATETQEVRTITVTFVMPESASSASALAVLNLAFSDYGKAVVIDRPVKQLTVRPEIFSRIVGTGEILPQP